MKNTITMIIAAALMCSQTIAIKAWRIPWKLGPIQEVSLTKGEMEYLPGVLDALQYDRHANLKSKFESDIDKLVSGLRRVEELLGYRIERMKKIDTVASHQLKEIQDMLKDMVESIRTLEYHWDDQEVLFHAIKSIVQDCRSIIYELGVIKEQLKARLIGVHDEL